MKKIVFITNNFSVGGTERFLLDLIGKIQKDYSISLVTILGAGPLLEEFKKLNIDIYCVGSRNEYKRSFMQRLSALLLLPVSAFRLLFLLIRIKPDIVVTSLWQSDFIGMKVALFAGVKDRILIQHDVQKLSFIANLSKKFISLPLPKKIIANSNATKKFLIDNWQVNGGKIDVIYNGIDTEKFIKIEKIKPKNISIGIIGRLEPVKGHIFLLKALKILKDLHNLEPDVYIAGTGRLESSLKLYVADNNLKSVHFLGREDSPEFLKKIDILVVPSLHEGFCLAALEGLFVGKIVVASDIDAIKEFITDNQNGILFAKGDTKALAENLYRISTDKRFRDDLCDKTKIWAEKNKEKFDLSSVAKNYKKLFDSLVG